MAASRASIASSVAGSSGAPSLQRSASASVVLRARIGADFDLLARERHARHAELREHLRVELVGDRAQLGLGPRFQRVRQHEHLQVAVPEVRRDVVAVHLELLGDDRDDRLLVLLDHDGVLDRERRARSAGAEADDRAVDAVGELVDVLAVVGTGVADHAAGLDQRRARAVAAEVLVPHARDQPPRSPRAVGANADVHAGDRPAEIETSARGPRRRESRSACGPRSCRHSCGECYDIICGRIQRSDVRMDRVRVDSAAGRRPRGRTSDWQWSVASEWPDQAAGASKSASASERVHFLKVAAAGHFPTALDEARTTALGPPHLPFPAVIDSGIGRRRRLAAHRRARTAPTRRSTHGSRIPHGSCPHSRAARRVPRRRAVRHVPIRLHGAHRDGTRTPARP